MLRWDIGSTPGCRNSGGGCCQAALGDALVAAAAPARLAKCNKGTCQRLKVAGKTLADDDKVLNADANVDWQTATTPLAPPQPRKTEPDNERASSSGSEL